MVKGKIIKFLSTIFECIGIGGLIVYAYNYFTLRGKYDVIPAEIKANLNTYLLIGISGVLLFVILKMLKYFTRQQNNTEYQQMKMHLEEETPKNTNETYSNYIDNNYNVKEEYNAEPNYMYEEKKTYIAPKLVQENVCTVPTEKQATCSNCGSVVDKNATICLHCGFLLQSIETTKDRFDEQKFIIQTFKKLEDKFSELFDKIDKKLESLSINSNANVNMNTNVAPKQEYTQQYVTPTQNQYSMREQQTSQPYENSSYYYEEPKTQSKDPLVVVKYFMNKYLPIMVVVVLVIVGGFILLKSINNSNNKPSTLDAKTSFYEMANTIVNEVENKYKTIGMTLSKNTMYYTLSELNYKSNDYNSDKSYIAINTSDTNNVKFYISLDGINNYKDYSINITEKKDLDVTDVAMNTAPISDLDGKLLIDSGNTVTIYYKE